VGLGDAYMLETQPDRAITAYDEVIRLAPRDSLGRFRRGLARAAREQYREALDDMDQSLKLGRELPEVYDARGDIRARQGDAEGAKADHARAAELRSEAKPTEKP